MGALLVGPEPFSAEEGRLQPCLDEIGGESEGGDVNRSEEHTSELQSR